MAPCRPVITLHNSRTRVYSNLYSVYSRPIIGGSGVLSGYGPFVVILSF